MSHCLIEAITLCNLVDPFIITYLPIKVARGFLLYFMFPIVSCIGRMFAAFGALQSVSSMVGSLVYNSIYPQTLSWWPGFCFDFAAVLLLIPILLTV